METVGHLKFKITTVVTITITTAAAIFLSDNCIMNSSYTMSEVVRQIIIPPFLSLRRSQCTKLKVIAKCVQ